MIPIAVILLLLFFIGCFLASTESRRLPGQPIPECEGCDYNLVGLPPTASCPECSGTTRKRTPDHIETVNILLHKPILRASLLVLIAFAFLASRIVPLLRIHAYEIRGFSELTALQVIEREPFGPVISAIMALLIFAPLSAFLVYSPFYGKLTPPSKAWLNWRRALMMTSALSAFIVLILLSHRGSAIFVE